MKLSDLKAGSNTKQTLLLPVASPYPVEITAICGSQPGKTLIVTAGIHGCEYPGIISVRAGSRRPVRPRDPSSSGKPGRLLPGQQTDNSG